MKDKYKKMTLEEAANAILLLISFYSTIGFDPKADKKLGSFVNEIKRDFVFTEKVEDQISALEGLLADILEKMALQNAILTEEIISSREQLELLRSESTIAGRQMAKRVKRGKCTCCSTSYCTDFGSRQSQYKYIPKTKINK